MKIVKILKEKSREYNGKPYYKFKVNIPETVLASSGIKAGDNVEISAEKDKIILSKANSAV